MRDFVRLYGQLLKLLLVSYPVAWWLIPANLAMVLALFAEPILFGRIVDALTQIGQHSMASGWVLVAPFLVAWVGLGVFEIICSSFVALQADRLAHLQRQRLLTESFERVLHFSAAQFEDLHTGRLIKVITQGVDALWALWLGFFRDHLSSFLALIVLLPLTFYLNWRLAGLLVGLCIVFAYLSYFVLKNTQVLQKEVEQYHSAMAQRLSDTLGNISVVQSFVRVDEEVRILKNISSQLLDAQLPVLSWWAFVKVLTRVSTTITLVSMMAMGVWLFVNSLTTVGEIVTFISIAMMVVGRLEQTVQFVIGLSRDIPKLRDFTQLSSVEGQIKDAAHAKVLDRALGRIEFQDVSFSYDGQKNIIDRLSFVIEPGQKVALVGLSGAGKSTILKLLLREYDVDAGSISIDGVDIREIQLDSLRKNIGVVFQEPLLFNRSIAENLLIGNPFATQEGVIAAAQAAQAYGFIAQYPDGFETTIGERGRNLSGGERQRITLARMLLKNPPIVVLDEATSSLDSQTEAALIEAFEEVMLKRTSLVIAHRLATVKKADLIFVIDAGKISECGTYEGLITLGGAFSQFAKNQFLDGAKHPNLPDHATYKQKN